MSPMEWWKCASAGAHQFDRAANAAGLETCEVDAGSRGNSLLREPAPGDGMVAGRQALIEQCRDPASRSIDDRELRGTGGRKTEREMRFAGHRVGARDAQVERVSDGRAGRVDRTGLDDGEAVEHRP